MSRKLIFALPILCSLVVVGRTIWHAVQAPFNMKQANTRFAMEAEKKNWRKKTGNIRNLNTAFNVEVYVRYDEYADDIEWTLSESNGKVLVHYKANGTDSGQERTVVTPVSAGKFTFEMKDSYGDGTCCRMGDFDGHYKLSVNGKILAIGGEFADTSGLIEFTIDSDGNVKAMQDAYLGLQPYCLEEHAGKFNICLYLTTRAESFGNEWLPAFYAAKKKWETIIVGSGNSPVVFKQDLWQRPKKLDGIYITGEATPIDGKGGVLGSSGPRTMVTIRTPNPVNRNKYFKRTLTGEMRFDSDDIGRMLKESDTYRDVIVHEMGHVLGIGTMWEYNGLHSGKEDDPVYKGINAQREYTKLGFPGNLEVEVDYGPGTAGGHWDEECLRSEVMTGLADPDMKFSTITVGGMEDLGYEVNYKAADAFKLPDHYDCGHQDPKNPIKRIRLLSGRNRNRILSDKGRTSAITYGELQMQDCRERHENITLPKDVVFIGDTKRHVLYEEDGHIYSVEVRGKRVVATNSTQTSDLKEQPKPLSLNSREKRSQQVAAPVHTTHVKDRLSKLSTFV